MAKLVFWIALGFMGVASKVLSKINKIKVKL